MSENERTSDDGGIVISEDRARAVDEAGRRAGAALRSPAPALGAAAIQGRAHRRRVVRVAAATAGVVVLLAAGVMALKIDGSGEQQPVDTVTTPTNPPVPTGPLDVVDAGTILGAYSARYSPDGSLLAIESFNGTVLIHDSATLTQLRELPCPSSLESLPASVGTGDSRDVVWDVAAAERWDDEALSVFKSPFSERLCDVSVSADGSRAVSEADIQGETRRSLLWDTSDGSLLAVIPGRPAGFSTDGSRLAIANGPSLSLLDASIGAVVTTITDDATGMASSPDGSRLLRWGRSTNADGTGVDATIYDMQTLTPVATLSGVDEDPVFDDTSGRVAALGASGATIWDASTGIELQHVSVEFAVNGHSVALSPGGALIAVRNGSHITIFDSSSGVQLADLDLGADSFLQDVVFSPDGVSLAAEISVVGSEEPIVRVWFYGRTD